MEISSKVYSSLAEYRKDVLSRVDPSVSDFIKDLFIYCGDLDNERNYGRDVADHYIEEWESNNCMSFYDNEIEDIYDYFYGYLDYVKNQYIRDDTFVESNPHPDGRNVDDCVKRAFVHALGWSYREVQIQLNRIKRELKASSYNSNEVWKEAVKRFGFDYVKINQPKKGEPRMNGHRFCVEHPEGTYILNMANHLTCCKDGKIYDTWDCRDKAVYQAFRLK